MTRRERIADAICSLVETDHGPEVWIGVDYDGGQQLRREITEALAEYAAPLAEALRVAEAALVEADSEMRDMWPDHPVRKRNCEAREQARAALARYLARYEADK